jgi:uncharacterized protein with PQ loop repeat
MSNCTEPFVEWIEDAFGECVETPVEMTGFILGLLSTLCWMYSTIPQIYLNFKAKNVEGISIGFMLLLTAGDIANCVGVFITHGLATQKIAAGWFITADVCCLSQYFYYIILVPRCCPPRTIGFDDIGRVPVPLTPFFVAAAAALGDNPYKPPALWGMLLGWFSAASYIASRIPQILLNFQRKKTDGLSPQFFIAAVLANTFYATSIFMKSPTWEYIWSQFPWILGSAGILIFDGIVLTQFLVFGAQELPEEATKELLTDPHQ